MLIAAATGAGWVVQFSQARMVRFTHPDAEHGVLVEWDRVGRIATATGGRCRWVGHRARDKSATVVRWLTERNECTLCQLKQ